MNIRCPKSPEEDIKFLRLELQIFVSNYVGETKSFWKYVIRKRWQMWRKKEEEDGQMQGIRMGKGADGGCSKIHILTNPWASLLLQMIYILRRKTCTAFTLLICLKQEKEEQMKKQKKVQEEKGELEQLKEQEIKKNRGRYGGRKGENHLANFPKLAKDFIGLDLLFYNRKEYLYFK